jgi:hypothetical protein
MVWRVEIPAVTIKYLERTSQTLKVSFVYQFAE